MYICMTDTPASRLIFQLADDIIPSFPVGDFTFRYLRSFIDDDEDIYIYAVSRGTDFRVQFFIIGVDVPAPTGVLCNVDFIHFVWNNFEFISHKRFALTLIPSGYTEGKPMLLGLKYYRAICDGWKDGSNCITCMEDYRQRVRDDVCCLLHRTCRCNVCLRQPPKLFDLAQHVYSKMVYNLDRFMLTPDTTYGQYVYAALSILVRYTQLLPPTYPNITLHCRLETLTHRLH
jgi:hypothetical protein